VKNEFSSKTVNKLIVKTSSKYDNIQYTVSRNVISTTNSLCNDILFNYSFSIRKSELLRYLYYSIDTHYIESLERIEYRPMPLICWYK